MDRQDESQSFPAGFGVERFSSGSRWEAAVGYSRAVRAGALVFVAGTTATAPDGAIVDEGDAYAQTRRALANVEAALGDAGATVADVVQTRLYVRDIARWEEVGRAHAEVFGEDPADDDHGRGLGPDRPPDAGGGRGDGDPGWVRVPDRWWP